MDNEYEYVNIKYIVSSKYGSLPFRMAYYPHTESWAHDIVHMKIRLNAILYGSLEPNGFLFL